MRVAALTMMHNEPVWARVWVRHYANQMGAGNCFVLDHGSTDGSTANLGVTVERVPRTALDEDARARIVSDVAAQLLRRYDAVLHADADELVLADPARYPDLRAYAAEAPPVDTALGLELQHIPDEEAPLDPAAPLGGQRRWVRFSGAMCKPALIRRPVRWTPGFHGCDAPRAEGALVLVHLRYADLDAGLVRLRRTRSQAFASPDANPHQRVDDDAFESLVRRVASLPRETGTPAVLAEPFLARMREGWTQGEANLNLAGTALWELPPAFRSAL